MLFCSVPNTYLQWAHDLLVSDVETKNWLVTAYDWSPADKDRKTYTITS